MMYLGVENDDTVVVYGGKNCFRLGRAAPLQLGSLPV